MRQRDSAVRKTGRTLPQDESWWGETLRLLARQIAADSLSAVDVGLFLYEFGSTRARMVDCTQPALLGDYHLDIHQPDAAGDVVFALAVRGVVAHGPLFHGAGAFLRPKKSSTTTGHAPIVATIRQHPSDLRVDNAVLKRYITVLQNAAASYFNITDLLKDDIIRIFDAYSSDAPSEKAAVLSRISNLSEESLAALADTLARGIKAAALGQAAETPAQHAALAAPPGRPLPDKAPELYRDRPRDLKTGRQEGADKFIARVYEPWIADGTLYVPRGELRRLDAECDFALSKWLSNHKGKQPPFRLLEEEKAGEGPPYTAEQVRHSRRIVRWADRHRSEIQTGHGSDVATRS